MADLASSGAAFRPVARLFRRVRSDAWLKPFRNAGVLLVGRTARGAMALAYLALAARDLETVLFGTLVLVHSFVLAVADLAKFQSWQIVLRYGAPAIEDGDRPRFQTVLKFGLLLDALSAAIGLAVIVLATAPAARLFGIPPEAVEMARLYGLGVVFMLLGATPTGVLRLFDRFDRLAIHSTIAPLVRLAGGIVLYLSDAGLGAYLAVWFLSTAVARLVLSLFAWQELRRRDLLRGLTRQTGHLLRPAPGIWRFAFGTNLSGSLGLAQSHLGILAVGWLLGPAAAGLFRIARQFSDSVVKPQQKLLTPAIYPELARLTARRENAARRTMVVRSAALAGGLSLLALIALALFGKPLIGLVAGPDYMGAYATMVLLAVAGVIATAAFPLEPLLISKGRVRPVVFAQTLALIVYATTLYVFCREYGLIGAGIAAIAYAVTVALLYLLFGRLRIRPSRPIARDQEILEPES